MVKITKAVCNIYYASWMQIISCHKQAPITKIIPGAPAIKVNVNFVKPSSARFCASDLPAEIKKGWSDKFCPLWRNFLGMLTDPWDTDNPMIKSEMQVCFDAIYPDSQYGVIQQNDVVYSVVSSQRYKHILLTCGINRLCNDFMIGGGNLQRERLLFSMPFLRPKMQDPNP
jgi:hypothetical protein